jgi:hypothetical protein
MARVYNPRCQYEYMTESFRIARCKEASVYGYPTCAYHKALGEASLPVRRTIRVARGHMRGGDQESASGVLRAAHRAARRKKDQEALKRVATYFGVQLNAVEE